MPDWKLTRFILHGMWFTCILINATPRFSVFKFERCIEEVYQVGVFLRQLVKYFSPFQIMFYHF